MVAIHEPLYELPCLWSLQPILIQTGMLSHRDLKVDNYEHLIYYLDNENKSRSDHTDYYNGK